VDEVSQTPISSEEYNYASFPLNMDMPSFIGFRKDAPGPGESAPDGEDTAKKVRRAAEQARQLQQATPIGND
jgi:hypothetical protein